MEISTLIKDAYKNAKEKGFIDQDENKNLSGYLIQVISELIEAREADRINKRTLKECLVKLNSNSDLDFKNWFEVNIKDTFEDEIADTFICLATLCGKYNIDIEKHIELKMKYNRMRQYLNNKKY